MKHLVKQLSHYIPLIGILVTGFTGMILFSTDRNFQQVIMIAVSASYVSWGMVHHLAHKDLTFTIILEYFAVALLGLIIVFSLFFRA
jgi:hypothetical protein